jgi:hypothetical protein
VSLNTDRAGYKLAQEFLEGKGAWVADEGIVRMEASPASTPTATADAGARRAS